MTSTINVTPKKRGRPATGKQPHVSLRMHPDVIRALEDVLRDPNVPVVNTSEAIRFIVETWLLERGYLKSAPIRLTRL